MVGNKSEYTGLIVIRKIIKLIINLYYLILSIYILIFNFKILFKRENMIKFSKSIDNVYNDV